MEDGKLIGWEALTDDERDLFKNPHQKTPSERFSTGGFGLRDKALLAVAKLDEEGKQKALATLDEATSALDRYDRAYPRSEVDEIRSSLKRDLGLE